LARSGSAAAASGTLHTSGASPGDRDVDIDHDNYKDEDDDYEDDTSDGDDDDNNDNALGEADAPPEDKNSCRVNLMAGVVCTHQDYGLHLIVPVPDASASAPAAFEAVELQAQHFLSLIHSCMLASSQKKIS
jgi:hypothetical protein